MFIQILNNLLIYDFLKRKCEEEDEGDDFMGFGLFDSPDPIPAASQKQSYTSQSRTDKVI